MPARRSSARLGHRLDLLQRRLGSAQMVARSLRAFLHPLGKRNGLAIPNVLREPKIDEDDVVRIHGGTAANAVPRRLTLIQYASVPVASATGISIRPLRGRSIAVRVKLFRSSCAPRAPATFPDDLPRDILSIISWHQLVAGGARPSLSRLAGSLVAATF
jgi:hypothetical protein